MSGAGLIIVMPMSIGIVWLIWYVWNNNRKLDQRIASGDVSLLSSSNYNLTEVVRAPAGSRVERAAIQMVAPSAGNYVRQILPDGRVALIPVTNVHQPIRSVHSTTHTNQQHPK